MYSVVEFDKKEYSVVPFNWITEDNKCFWPSCTKKEVFQKWIASKQAPLSNWKKYSINKIHRTFATQSEAEEFLNKLIMEQESSSSDNTNSQAVTLKKIGDTPENELAASKAKKIVRDEDDASSDGFSSDDNTYNSTNLRQAVNDVMSASKRKGSPSLLKQSKKKRLDDESSDDFATNATPSSCAGSAIATPTSSNRPDVPLTEALLRRLEKVISVQDQHSVMLDNILRNVYQQTDHFRPKPTDFPNLPIGNKAELRAVEEFLNHEDKFSYMVQRLSTIGGCSVRNTTMNMLKYLLTNQVAMKFNWSGKDKRPFKRTKMCSAIIEAVKRAYNGNGIDLTDKTIKESIQDWLKLAKSRYNYNLKNHQ